MKIIHILNELRFSGAEIMYVDSAALFQQKGCELMVVATANDLGEYAPFFEHTGYKVLHKPYPPLTNVLKRLKYIWKFSRFLKKERINVVHIHSHNCMWGFSFAAWLAARKRSVYTFHNVFHSPKITYLYHYLRRWSAKNIFKCRFQTISDSVYDNELNYFHNSTIKIYNWYGSNRFYPALMAEKEKTRQGLNISENTLVLISVGGCSPVKRHSDILKALPLIIKQIPDCLYLHLGTGVSECEEKTLAGELGLTDFVRFIGNQTDVRKHLIVSDIYLMPSRFEGISITTIEAMACGIPAILYNVPGLHDFNKEGENSILIPEDYEILAKKVVELRNNPQQAIEMVGRAKKFVDEKFSMEKNVEYIYDLYKS
jgi:glycosyltransferase involved in cell wall biosynthesis